MSDEASEFWGFNDLTGGDTAGAWNLIAGPDG